MRKETCVACHVNIICARIYWVRQDTYVICIFCCIIPEGRSRMQPTVFRMICICAVCGRSGVHCLGRLICKSVRYSSFACRVCVDGYFTCRYRADLSLERRAETCRLAWHTLKRVSGSCIPVTMEVLIETLTPTIA